MRKLSNLISAVSIIVILAVTVLSTQFTANANAQQATGQTNILGTCGLSFPNGNSVNYGSLVPNTISAEKKLNMTNTGTVQAVLKVTGTNWKDSGGNSVLLVNRTHYNITSGTYLQKIPLQTFEQRMTNYFMPSTILQTFWQLQAVLLNPSFTGTTTQTMNFTVSCQPTTVEITSTDPENGYLGISGSSCSTGSTARTVTEDIIMIGPRLYNPDLSATGCHRAWVTWDVSGIPDSATVLNVEMKFEKLPKSHPLHDGNVQALIYSLEYKPDLVSDALLRADIRDGVLYVNGDPNFSVNGNHTTNLSSLAKDALTSKLNAGTNWFGIGLSASNESTLNWNLAEIDNDPVLVVTYLP